MKIRDLIIPERICFQILCKTFKADKRADLQWLSAWNKMMQGNSFLAGAGG